MIMASTVPSGSSQTLYGFHQHPEFWPPTCPSSFSLQEDFDTSITSSVSLVRESPGDTQSNIKM